MIWWCLHLIKNKKSLMRFIFLIVFLINLHPASLCIAAANRRPYNASSPSGQRSVLLMDEKELALKKWSYNALSEIMTFNHDNFMDRLDANKALQTEDGCKRLLWIMEIFNIKKAINRKESVRIIPRQKFTINRTIENISFDLTGGKIVKTLGYSEGTKMWKIYIPVAIEYSKGLKKSSWKFVAAIRVMALSDRIGDYAIISWYPASSRKSMKRKHDTKFKSKNYEVCESIDFVNTDHLKAK